MTGDTTYAEYEPAALDWLFGANLRGIRLLEADEYAAFHTGLIVYHDDLGDYSTNEPIMDGTANIAYVLAALAPSAPPVPR